MAQLLVIFCGDYLILFPQKHAQHSPLVSGKEVVLPVEKQENTVPQKRCIFNHTLCALSQELHNIDSYGASAGTLKGSFRTTITKRYKTPCINFPIQAG